MEPPIDLDDASSSDGQQVDMRNHIHVGDYFNSVSYMKNDYMLRGLEAERRLNEISENIKIFLKAELHNNQGESDIQNMQQQNVIDDLLNQIRTPYSICSDKKAKPPFPADPVLNQHLRSVGMSQQSRQAPASSSNNTESAHEPKGKAGRPRNDHGVSTETRKDPLWWSAQPAGFIQTQLSNMRWRTPHFQHFTPKGAPAKRLAKEHHFCKKKNFFLIRGN